MLLQQMAMMPVMPLWGGARFQPIDSGEVAVGHRTWEDFLAQQARRGL